MNSRPSLQSHRLLFRCYASSAGVTAPCPPRSRLYAFPEVWQRGHKLLRQYYNALLFLSFSIHLTDVPGSPLNRVSFLRGDHSFIRQAFDHGTTQFLIFKELSPLVKSNSEIAYVKYDDIKPILQNNPYEKTEEQIIREYNSSSTTPQLVFLGLDESRTDGLHYRNFVGAPQFALDITPQRSYEDEAKEVIAELEKRGLRFLEGMRAMNFPATVGR